MSESVRADKWLWATRFFKTRGVAATACEEGKVVRNGHPLKPASGVRCGDVLQIPFVEGPGERTVVVLGLIDKRVGAPEAQACYEERTEPAVFERQREWHLARKEGGRGRPTKRNRRQIDRIRGFWE